MRSSGADVLVQQLVSKNVDTIFAITGAGNLAIIDAIVRDGRIKIIYSHHEQAVVMEAQGYSRISGKLGVALVTTGGGTSNVVTGVLSAHLDSVPVLIISGNESSYHCLKSPDLRAYGVQGFDSVAVLKPISKYSERIESSEDVSRVIEKAIEIAEEGRKGPAHIDFPMDLQRSSCTLLEFEKISTNQSNPRLNIESIISKLELANRPLIYFGNGCREDIAEIHAFITKHQIPYAVSWSAIDLFDDDDPLNIGRIGIYGSHSANILLQKSDLLISIGTRLAIPQIGYDKQDFGRSAKKIVVDIDATELAKFQNLGWELVHSPVKAFISSLMISKLQIEELSDWKNAITHIREELPLETFIGPGQLEGYVHSAEVLKELPKLLEDDAIIVTDVGAPLLNGHYILKLKKGQRLFTSQGLGEMGFGLPAAIGAYFANPTRQIICLNTDGAIMFNLQELQVVKHHQIPLKLFIFNNGGYGMIKISQQNLFDSRLSGSDISTGISFPDFETLANTFNFKYERISSVEDLLNLSEALSNPTPILIDVKMDPDQKYFPRLATNKLPDGSFVSPPLEDLTPFMPIELLEKLLGYKPKNASYEARGIKVDESE
jgi:acetolactate synthase-1/2/3 large subunit